MWILAALAIFVAILLTGVVYQKVGLAKDARRFPAPGQMIDVDGRRLHADIAGHGMQPVVFEAGIAATSLSWRLIQSEIAKSTQTISYDRAGLGWSEAFTHPRELSQLVEELRAMLAMANIAAPRVLVAHSFGGMIAAAYASRYPEEVAAMVLIDPIGAEWAKFSEQSQTPQSQANLRRGIFLARCGKVLAHFGIVRFALSLLASGARNAPKAIARATSGRGGAAFTERMVGQIRKLPPDTWPVIQSHWCDPKCFRSMAHQLAMLPQCATAVQELTPIEVPFVVLSAGDASPAQRAGQQELVDRSAHGGLEVVAGSGHWIQLDRPDVVVDAVKEALTAALRRSNTAS